VCLNYFVGSSALLKGLFTPVFCCSGVFERTVITIIVILLQGVALHLAVCGAVRNFGVSLDRRGSTVGNCRYYFAYLFLPLALLYLLNQVFFIFLLVIYILRQIVNNGRANFSSKSYGF